MSLNAYLVVCTVAKERSFIRAAEVLHVTPSAVSHSVANLEKRFDFPLFIRNQKSMDLTNEGIALLPHFQAILENEEDLIQKVAQIQKLETGTVKFGVFNSVCVSWLPEIIQTFKLEHPGIDVTVYQGGCDLIETWLENNSIDLALISLSNVNKKMNVTPLYKDPMICITPKHFHPAHESFVTAEDICNEIFISMRPGDDIDMRNSFRMMDISPPTPFQAVDDMSVVAMVKSGLGLCILPQLLLDLFSKDSISSVNMYSLVPPTFRIICLVMRKDLYASPAVMHMHRHIMDFVESRNLRNMTELV